MDSNNKFPVTSEGYHKIRPDYEGEREAGYIVKMNEIIPKNSGTWRIAIKIQGNVQPFNYLGFIHSNCNVSGNLSNYFGSQSQSGKVFNYGTLHHDDSSVTWCKNDIIILTIDTEENTASFRNIRDGYPDDTFFTGPIKFTCIEKYKNHGIIICFNVTGGTHIDILRFQKLIGRS